jgi:hypothetical protein
MPRREAEQIAQRSVVALTRAARRSGIPATRVARTLGISPRTIARLEERWKTEKLTVYPRGREAKWPEPHTRNKVIEKINKLGPKTGVEVLRTHFKGISRSALQALLWKYRDHLERRERRALYALRWSRSGAVWASDHVKPPQPIDGVFPQTLATRDLGASFQVGWAGVISKDGPTTAARLEAEYVRHGAPLVQKFDGGLASPEMRALLQKFDVIGLQSPPHLAKYNGGCEAANNSMEDWTDHQTALHGRPGWWTSADLAAARALANANARPWGVDGPAPAEVFAVRTPITTDERRAFRNEVLVWERSLSRGRARTQGPLTDADRKDIRRHAIEVALLRLEYLTKARRGVVSPPIRN